MMSNLDVRNDYCNDALRYILFGCKLGVHTLKQNYIMGKIPLIELEIPSLNERYNYDSTQKTETNSN